MGNMQNQAHHSRNIKYAESTDLIFRNKFIYMIHIKRRCETVDFSLKAKKHVENHSNAPRTKLLRMMAN